MGYHMGGFHVGDFLIQLFSFGMIIILIFLVIAHFRSLSKQIDKLNNIERKIDAIQDQLNKDDE